MLTVVRRFNVIVFVVYQHFTAAQSGGTVCACAWRLHQVVKIFFDDTGVTYADGFP
jgi:hypothetical protein